MSERRALRYIREVIGELRDSTISDAEFAQIIVEALDTVLLLVHEPQDVGGTSFQVGPSATGARALEDTY